ncbi:MAG: hypothetical protein II864_11610 [Prevotella sp.]|nr:hypothetical protein [Prevotella sp.]
MMKRIRQWLLNLLFQQHEPTPEPTPKQEEEKIEVVSRQPMNGRTKQLIAKGVEKFFNDHYDLRFNILKRCEEFRPLASEKAPGFAKKAPGFAKKAPGFEQKAPGFDGGWQQLTDRELRRIAFEQMKEVGVAWSIDIELYARSTMIPDYDPIADFLSHTTPWDGTTDHIGQLARRVPTAFSDWPDYFHRWFLGMVAQWQQRSRDYGNALVPMLIGGQGTHKSTFCKLLLPRSLREYYIDDIKLDSAEQVERMLARMLLVNIDEYNAKTPREQAKIKRVLTEHDVQTRRMRSDDYLMLPRMASFIATTNEREPLADPTGSRRYLCCELTGIIDTTSPIDHAALFGQAIAELDAGATWYLSRDEEAALEQHNEQYRQQATAEDLLTARFEPAPRQKEHFMRATDIMKALAKDVRAADLPNLKQLTLALRQCRFPHGAIDGQRGWYAQRRQ